MLVQSVHEAISRGAPEGDIGDLRTAICSPLATVLRSRAFEQRSGTGWLAPPG